MQQDRIVVHQAQLAAGQGRRHRPCRRRRPRRRSARAGSTRAVTDQRHLGRHGVARQLDRRDHDAIDARFLPQQLGGGGVDACRVADAMTRHEVIEHVRGEGRCTPSVVSRSIRNCLISSAGTRPPLRFSTGKHGDRRDPLERTPPLAPAQRPGARGGMPRRRATVVAAPSPAHRPRTATTHARHLGPSRQSPPSSSATLRSLTAGPAPARGRQSPPSGRTRVWRAITSAANRSANRIPVVVVDDTPARGPPWLDCRRT